ncbi:MAG TPA: acyloxyacyl hydrolase [Thermoanaerobaculia bacterium]|nr:acyloxyacyl hydrolase [Thermoanaerobaculia bacterium]
MKRLTIVVALAIALPASAQYLHLNRVYATGGKSLTTRFGQSDMQGFDIEYAHAFSPRMEIGFTFAPMSLKQPKILYGDVYGGGDESLLAMSSSMFARYIFNADSQRVRPYVELSTGPMWSQKRVPASTSHFNFISQAGAGVTLFPDRRIAMILGWRFSHISNAGYAPRNPGLNVNSIVIGAQLRR